MNLIETGRRARATAEEVTAAIVERTDSERVAVADIEARRNDLQASINDAARLSSDVDAKIDDARRRRGLALADGASTATLDKELGSLRCERERLQDLSATLLERIANVDRELRAARATLLDAKTRALGRALDDSKRNALEAKESYELACAVRDVMQQKVNAYAEAAAFANK